jgi:thioredoxin reductase (NADPH)
VVAVRGEQDGGFTLDVARAHDTKRYRAADVVFATGYYDNPNFLNIPGEDLPHVTHYFLEGHPYWHRRVVVIGAGNSSVDAALECWRAGATVTMVHFADGFDRTVKAWVLPDITNRVKQGSIAARWRTRVRAITPTEVELVSDAGAIEQLPCDAVLAMTGYHADTSLLRQLGVSVDESSGVPAHDERSMATSIEGVYLAGVIASGNDANRLFIENARGHGELIVRDILARRRSSTARAGRKAAG